MNPSSSNPAETGADTTVSDAAAERLARLSPQQRELLLRQLAARNAAAAPKPDAVTRRSVAGMALPLSPAQQRMWFFERFQPGTGAYHVCDHLRLRGALDLAALRNAFAHIVRRHDTLRTGFSEVAGEPRQTVFDEVAFDIPTIDLSHLAPELREQEIQRLVDAETERPFDLGKPPLMRASLLRVDAHDHVLMVVLHHIVSDAWSIGVIYDELGRLYAAGLDGASLDAALPELAVQFGDCVLWQREPAQEQRVAAHMAFWRDALAGHAGLLDLPTDQPRSATALGRGRRQSLQLPKALADGVAELARREGATLFMALLAAFQTLLARHSGQDDIVVGSPVANRGLAESTPLIGLFVNTVALRGDLSGDPSFRQLLARTRSHCLDAFEHVQAPLERVVDQLRIERVPGRTPLFQTMFVLQNAVGAPLSLPGLELDWINPQTQAARFELTLSLAAGSDGINGVLDYDIDLFDAGTAQRLLRQFEHLLGDALAHPDRPLSQLALLDEADRNELLRLGHGGDAELDEAHEHLYAMFAQQAARTPDAVALIEPGRELTYRELLQRANGLGLALQALGVGAESRVGVLTDRSIEALVAVLGVLAAGAAYLPLDPAHPDERLHFLLDDTAALALVAPPQWRARADALNLRVPVLISDEIAASANAPALEFAPGHAAYVIYTSGSTGQPKGVVIEHRGAANLTRGFMARHDFKDQRLLMIPPLVFDASVGDVFPALASGSALVLHPNPTELGPFELEAFCREHRISAIDAPAALWRRWSEGWSTIVRSEPLLPHLRLMMIGGESVAVEQVRRFAQITDGRVALSNHYGPTETSVCAAMLSTIDASEYLARELPIGRPLPGVRLYVLDPHGALAPRGVVGELCIGGLGVARGYLNQPELSATSFPPDPFAADGRLYRTGDLARWNSDGSLQFLGRRDHQIKLRGFRIELGEIETALESHTQVEAAVVLLREDRPGDKRLVAYVVADDASGPNQWREHLARSLPEALLPSAYVRLPAMPLNRNGKVDRKALPEPSAELLVERTVIEARTDTERAVLAVWRDVLGREEISADDDFFSIGGDSLMTLPLVFKLHATLGVELPLASVFAAPTLAAQARRIDELLSGEAVDEFDLAAQVQLADDIHPRNAALPAASRANPRSAFITGATGFLGAYMVRELLDVSSAEVVCLVRAADADEGLARIRANLQGYGLWRSGDEARLAIVLGDLAQPRLGLDEAAFDALAQRAEVIFHNGGQVNFLAPYQHLEAANVGGTREVLRLATLHRIKPVHLVSTLGVCLTASNLDRTVFESDPPPSADEQYGGYNQSKWVGEQLALVARERGLPVAIYRPARITGDSHTGASNLGDYFNAWLKGCVQMGRAPHLPNEAFDMAPVDYVGRSIVRIALGAGDANGNFHFYNRRRLPIPTAVATLREAGLALDEIDYQQWRRELLAHAAVSRDNALAPFAGLFPANPDPREPSFDCSAVTRAVEPLGLICPPADAALLRLYVRFLQSRDFFPANTKAIAEVSA
ncbi:non-ribosomal peptide synthetase [Lysobacter capsici]|uniref:non-ribosomal peptide synthetase n=1 Tax=Lysobacter capsici TaxID=435897 RepID=UPI000BBB315D|nr:non-ribosomal peptide synthetase [Lysobacter capsici]ATE73892.1 non-ribosomal peptide synthetase [Lysobacter capsici]